MKVEIINARTKELIHELDDISIFATIKEIKDEFYKVKPKYYPSRQSFRIEPRAKMLSDETTLRSLEFDSTAKLYFKDLGPQISWKTVFLTEYAGPLFLYPIFYLRPAILYGENAASLPKHMVVHIACGAFCFHYAKRLLETQFIHRFSNGTMPVRNIFKNSSYYWLFACLVAYFVNHPLYTPPSFGDTQIYGGLFGFVLCQLGNYSCHVALRNLRPPGTKERKIPVPTTNPFTAMFSFVSCANYTYEIGSWLFFTIMTQTLTSGLFALVGTAQMTDWALKKHRNYRKEFKDYPRSRKSIIPFLI